VAVPSSIVGTHSSRGIRRLTNGNRTPPGRRPASGGARTSFGGAFPSTTGPRIPNRAQGPRSASAALGVRVAPGVSLAPALTALSLRIPVSPGRQHAYGRPTKDGRGEARAFHVPGIRGEVPVGSRSYLHFSSVAGFNTGTYRAGARMGPADIGRGSMKSSGRHCMSGPVLEYSTGPASGRGIAVPGAVVGRPVVAWRQDCPASGPGGGGRGCPKQLVQTSPSALACPGRRRAAKNRSAASGQQDGHDTADCFAARFNDSTNEWCPESTIRRAWERSTEDS